MRHTRTRSSSRTGVATSRRGRSALETTARGWIVDGCDVGSRDVCRTSSMRLSTRLGWDDVVHVHSSWESCVSTLLSPSNHTFLSTVWLLARVEPACPWEPYVHDAPLVRRSRRENREPDAIRVGSMRDQGAPRDVPRSTFERTNRPPLEQEGPHRPGQGSEGSCGDRRGRGGSSPVLFGKRARLPPAHRIGSIGTRYRFFARFVSIRSSVLPEGEERGGVRSEQSRLPLPSRTTGKSPPPFPFVPRRVTVERGRIGGGSEDSRTSRLVHDDARRRMCC